MEAEVPADSRGFLALLRAGSLTTSAQGGSAQPEGLLALHESEAAAAGAVPMACATSTSAQPSGARREGANHPALASLSEEENSCLTLAEIINFTLGM